MNPWNATLRGVTIGQGTVYPGMGGIIGAVGTPSPTSHDQASGYTDGMRATWERYPKRTLRIPIEVLGSAPDDGSDTEAKIAALKTAWRRSDVDLELDVRLAAAGGHRYYGRPRGLDDSSHGKLVTGWAHLVATFDCLDPYGYSLDTTDSGVDSSSPIVVTNAGNAPSLRATLSVVGNGGTPSIVNTSDPETGDITFRLGLSGGETASIDLRTMIATVSGVNIDDRMLISSKWFALQPGANTITFSGCASVQVVWRDAYE